MQDATARRLLAAISCACACAAGAAPLDTLFHTPAERERLDRLRRGESVAPQATTGQPRRREITGFVKRSDGRGTAFIDGVPVLNEWRVQAVRGFFVDVVIPRGWHTWTVEYFEDTGVSEMCFEAVLLK